MLESPRSQAQSTFLFHQEIRHSSKTTRMARYILSFCIFALFAAVVLASPVQEEDQTQFEDEIERGIVTKYLKKLVVTELKKLYKMINVDCVEEAIEHCHPKISELKQDFQCAIKYFQDNKEYCLNEV